MPPREPHPTAVELVFELGEQHQVGVAPQPGQRRLGDLEQQDLADPEPLVAQPGRRGALRLQTEQAGPVAQPEVDVAGPLAIEEQAVAHQRPHEEPLPGRPGAPVCVGEHGDPLGADEVGHLAHRAPRLDDVALRQHELVEVRGVRLPVADHLQDVDADVRLFQGRVQPTALLPGRHLDDELLLVLRLATQVLGGQQVPADEQEVDQPGDQHQQADLRELEHPQLPAELRRVGQDRRGQDVGGRADQGQHPAEHPEEAERHQDPRRPEPQGPAHLQYERDGDGHGGGVVDHARHHPDQPGRDHEQPELGVADERHQSPPQHVHQPGPLHAGGQDEHREHRDGGATRRRRLWGSPSA